MRNVRSKKRTTLTAGIDGIDFVRSKKTRRIIALATIPEGLAVCQ
jgi:hypothetical protein